MTGPLQPGRVASAMSLERVDGGKIAVPPKARPSLVVFFRHDCPTSRFAMPFVDRLRERIEAAGAPTEVIGVAQDSPEIAADFVDELGLRLTVACESDPWPLSSAFCVRFVPTLFLLGPDRAVKRTIEGFVRADYEALLVEAGGGDGEPLFRQNDEVPDFKPG